MEAQIRFLLIHMVRLNIPGLVHFLIICRLLHRHLSNSNIKAGLIHLVRDLSVKIEATFIRQ